MLRKAHLETHAQLLLLADACDACAAGVLEPGLGDDGAAGLLLLLGRRVGQMAEVELVVGAADLARVAQLHHVASLHQHRAVAEALDRVHVVRDKDDRLALALEAVELLEALLLEGCVADGEDLVDQQDLCLHLDRGCEGQAHEHPRGVVLQLQVDELLQFREGDHVVKAPPRLTAAEAEHDGVDDHVVARRQVHVEAHAQLDEGRQPTGHGDAPAVDAVDAGDALQQRALTAAVAAHDPEELAAGDLKCYSGDCVQLVVLGGAKRVQRPLLERRVLLVR